jgi:hypothetical protein
MLHNVYDAAEKCFRSLGNTFTPGRLCHLTYDKTQGSIQSLSWRLPRSLNGTVRSSHFPFVEKKKKKERNYQFLLVRTVGAAINLLQGQFDYFFSSSSVVMRWKTKIIIRGTSPNRAMFEHSSQSFFSFKKPGPGKINNRTNTVYSTRWSSHLKFCTSNYIERYHIRTYTCARVQISRKIERDQQTLKINNSSSPSS